MRVVQLLFFITVISACTKPSEQQSKNEIEFNVDQALLGEQYVDSLSGFYFSVPKNWKSVLAISNASDSIAVSKSIRKIFIDSAANASLIITSMKGVDIEQAYKIFNSPDSTFNSARVWTSISKAEFLLGGITVHQYLIQNQEIVNFKLILVRGVKDIIQLDYLTQRDLYANQIKNIESSIGSIKGIVYLKE